MVSQDKWDNIYESFVPFVWRTNFIINLIHNDHNRPYQRIGRARWSIEEVSLTSMAEDTTREEELRTQNPSYGIIPRRQRPWWRKVRELKSWIEVTNRWPQPWGFTGTFDFAKEGEATEEEVDAQYQRPWVLEDIEMRNMLRREEDHFGAIMKINWSRRYGKYGLGQYAVPDVYPLGELNGYKVKHVWITRKVKRPVSNQLLSNSRRLRLGIWNRKTVFTDWFVYRHIMRPINEWHLCIRVRLSRRGWHDRDHDQPADISWDTFQSGGAVVRTWTRWKWSPVTPRSYRNHDWEHGITFTVAKPWKCHAFIEKPIVRTGITKASGRTG